MEPKLDLTKEYAIVLEGGGAKGSYEIGAWKALEEAGVRFSAVAGSSVGALNGALMVMGDLNEAVQLWENVTFSQIFEADDAQLKNLYDHKLSKLDLKSLVQDFAEIIREGGLDMEPLRELMAKYLDEEKIRNSGKKLYLVTYSLTDKREMDLDADEIEPGKLHDMLLASAYLPLFRREKLDGKSYVDGSVQNVLPINCLLERGYRDIIVMRIYGVGIEKKTKIPEDAHIITVAPTEKLGGILQFDAEQVKKDMRLGYFDCKRVLYGLAGEKYYIDRQWNEMQAYHALLFFVREMFRKKEPTVREINEKLLPKLAKKLKKKDANYSDILIAFLEKNAEELGISPFEIRTEEKLVREICEKSGRM